MAADGSQITPDLTCPYFQAGVAREQVRLAEARKEAARHGGVHFGGLESAPAKAKTIAEIHEAAEAEKARAGGPRAAFLRALNELEALGYYEADSVRSIYWRSLSDERRPVDAEPLARTVRVLNSIDHSTAREAIQALCDFSAPMMRAA